jgi:hypothetical protein
MSSVRNNDDVRVGHGANAQWLKDNPSSLPQVGPGRWAVYDRTGHLCGHITGDGPTRETRFKAVTAEGEPVAEDSFGITLPDAGAYLLDVAGRGDVEQAGGGEGENAAEDGREQAAGE